MTIQKWLEQQSASSFLILSLESSIRWFFIKDCERQQVLQSLKDADLANNEVHELDTALRHLGFKRIEALAPLQEIPYRIPMKVDIARLIRALRLPQMS